MVKAVEHILIPYPRATLDYPQVCILAGRLQSGPAPAVFTLDLACSTDATTAAFARLVLLRRHLLERGSDIHLRNLSGRANLLYLFNRMQELLPLD